MRANEWMNLSKWGLIFEIRIGNTCKENYKVCIVCIYAMFVRLLLLEQKI